MLPLECAEASGKTVAVIGAGPAGLLAAHDLRKAGHAVSVYEAEGKAGGVLRNILPVWKLPDAVLDEAVGIMEQAGVVFHYGQRIVDQKAWMIYRNVRCRSTRSGSGRRTQGVY